MRFLMRVLAVCSQGVNVVLFRGHQNDSISSRCHREKRHAARRFIDGVLKPFEADHCRKSHENDIAWAEALIRDHKK
jgi:hypothetical protein